jgi:hypothetical protein
MEDEAPDVMMATADAPMRKSEASGFSTRIRTGKR